MYGRIKSLYKTLVPMKYRVSVYDSYFHWRRRLFLVFALGFHLTCPMCGWSFRRFMTGGWQSSAFREWDVIGGGWRKNDVCPRCGCSDRERLVFLYLQNRTPILSIPVRLLHIAPEKNLRKRLLSHRNISYLSADYDSLGVDVCLDITSVPLRDDIFDVIICNHVLEHVPEDRKAMAELFRVLKPGGFAILQVPQSRSLLETLEGLSVSSAEDRLRLFGQADHVRIYGQDYEDRLLRTGFIVESRSALELFGPTVVEKRALIGEERLYVCRKSVPQQVLPG